MKMKVNFLLACCLYITATCNQPVPESNSLMSISVVHDVTDPHLLQPEGESILSLYNLQEEKETGVDFRYRQITDMTLVPTVDIHLPDEVTGEKLNREDRPMYREQKILEFYDTVRKVINANTQNITDTSALGHSECFRTICDELSRLTAKRSSKRVLLLFSNLQENSTIFNVYSAGAKKVLKESPLSTVAIFEKTKLMPGNLHGVTVIFCYQPKDRADDNAFNHIAEIFKTILEQHGARVMIQADNKHFDI